MKAALILTLGRVVLCPIFLVIYLYYAQLGMPLFAVPYALLVITLICELSDVFDGIIARRKKAVTELGKILDPMADSIVKMSVFLSFTQGPVQLPLLLVLIFVVREAVVGALRTLCALQGVALAARMSGKLKTIFQGIAIFLILILMIPYTLDILPASLLQAISFWIVLPVALYAFGSGVEYIWVHRRLCSLSTWVR